MNASENTIKKWWQKEWLGLLVLFTGLALSGGGVIIHFNYLGVVRQSFIICVILGLAIFGLGLGMLVEISNADSNRSG